jgi:hypothetical protein
MDMPKLRKTVTGTAKGPRPEVSTRTEKVRLTNGLGDSRKPGTYKEPLTNMKIDIVMNMIIC